VEGKGMEKGREKAKIRKREWRDLHCEKRWHFTGASLMHGYFVHKIIIYIIFAHTITLHVSNVLQL